jgi:non-specific serine/threonine protein kinase
MGVSESAVANQPGHNLPAEIDSFIGRGHEIEELKAMLRRRRLVTLTGAGGSGKTRLALRLASEMVSSFADGVWFVPLAPLADSALLPQAVAGALGVQTSSGRSLREAIATAVASRRLLLVLDNCEHVIGTCARLTETLLSHCPNLRILATSREPLRVSGEVTWRVPPLTLPHDEPDPPGAVPEALAASEAAALFLDRARARRPDFIMTGENAAAVTGICRRLEGLPLAIELAAAQIGALAPAQIARLLDDALRLLEGGSRLEPRQETLRGALDWSYALLSEQEQLLFRRLAVFAGSFGVEAAESTCGGDGIEPGKVFALLRVLVEKSLVESQILADEARYRLLEPVRQYAHDRLAAQGEMLAVQRRHACYYLTLADEAEPKLMSADRGPTMKRLAMEEDSLRAALAWSRGADDVADREIGLRLAGGLVFYWHFRGQTGEGLQWVEEILARAGDASPAARAKALYGASELAWLAGQTELARARAEESEALWRALGDRRGLAYTLQSLPMATEHPRARDSVAESLRIFEEIGDAWGAALAYGAADIFPLMREGDPDGEGKKVLEEGLARARAVGDDWLTAQRLNFLGDLARSQSDDAAAEARYEEALQLLRGQNMTGTVPSLLHNLAYLALHRGDTRRALRLFRESLKMFRDQGDQRGMADCLDGVAGALAAMDRSQRAAELFGAAEALREAIGATIWPANAADRDRALALIRKEDGEAEITAAWTAGRSCPWERVVAGVLAEEPAGSGLPAGADLTQREREVAALIAEGLTNRQIGERLFITEGTARLHVKHILQKLGFRSRVEVARWALEQQIRSTTT